uniref:Protein kinase domain-containing protein n=1 Tax=Bicosoecida sp. CB-2014 TaxID=1486930 RepID=A0A7S1CB24_9STRA|mmetsp:Transcript_18399/g.65155  ORF Transcript_18399/g.65155 Transcript_18399/m.65155 type:complete len:476 (+) Transcript_18399:450-1877(+)
MAAEIVAPPAPVAIVMAPVLDHPVEFLHDNPMRVPTAAGAGTVAQLNLLGGAVVTMPPALPAGGVLADVVADTQFCRCGVVLRLPLSDADGTSRGDVAFKVLDKAAMANEGDRSVEEIASMEALAPRGLLLEGADGGRPVAGVPRWDCFDDGVNVYIVTEWAAGGSLSSWARRVVRELTAADRVAEWYSVHLPRLYYQLCAAVEHMHAHCVVHLDLDPKNMVMAEAADGSFDLLVIDFGSSRRVASEHALVGDKGIKFKLRYMSPQVATYYHTGVPFEGAPADVFCLGAILWWLLSLPICLMRREDDGTGRKHVPVDDVALDMTRHWRDNLLSHFTDGDAHAARAEAALAAAGGALPPYKASECMCCRWDFDIPTVWRQALYNCLVDDTRRRFTVGQLREHIEGILGALVREAAVADDAAVEEAVAADDAEAAEAAAAAAAAEAMAAKAAAAGLEVVAEDDPAADAFAGVHELGV